jgi:hypothetical protein
VATRATNEVLLHLLKIALYAGFGLLTTRSLMAGAVIAIAAVLASFAVRLVLHHVPDRMFHHASTTAMVVAGVSMLGGAVPAVLARNNAGVNVTASANEREVQAFWGRRAYAVAITRQNGIVLERSSTRPISSRAMPGICLRRLRARITSIEKFEQIDREGLEIRYADATRAWTQIVEFPD